MITTHQHLQRLKQTNTLDGLVGAKEVGRILDLHNDGVTKDKEKHFEKEMNDRNIYFKKLWLRAIEAMDKGEKSRPTVETKSTKIFLP